MEFVKVEWDSSGVKLDPRAYLAELPRLEALLPPGAWAYVSDIEHYSPPLSRSVKDLELTGIDVATDKSGSLTLSFAPNRWKHDRGLRIRYAGVSHFSIDYDAEADRMRVDTVLLDEVLPRESGGCLHEIELTGASIVVHCSDLEAVWVSP
ncbi:hypothetical protein [Streptomyces sp. NPDC046821]|uniref:hypothetical protein n=1 Tax=Streptomyces sp. NPDC046821 TaxID=3154702 RepID=UPI0033DA27C4